jgi:hypothetical protein
MSFLVRSRNSQKWGRTGSIPGATSFSVRTGRRSSGEADSVVLGRAGELQQACCMTAGVVLLQTMLLHFNLVLLCTQRFA